MILVKKILEDGFYDRRVMPLFVIGKHSGKNFKFHNNVDINIFIKWINNYTAKKTLPSVILS